MIFGQPIFLVHGGRINEFGGAKSISIGDNTIIKRNPDLPEGRSLREWFDNSGGGRDVRNTISTPKYEWLSIKEADIKNLGNDDKPYFYQIKGTITSIDKTNATYKSCAMGNCKKKVLDQGNGQYFCGQCNFESANFKYRTKVDVSRIFIFDIIKK